MSWLDDFNASYENDAPDLSPVIEPAISAATGTAAQIGALAGYGAMRLGGKTPESAKRIADQFQDFYTYRPRTEYGRAALGALGNGFERLANSAPVAAIADPIADMLIRTGIPKQDLAAAVSGVGLIAGGPEETVARLRGLPETMGRFAVAPGADVKRVAEAYRAQSGIEAAPAVNTYAPLNEDLGRRTAQAYGDMAHDPSDPEVASSYQALKNETLAQYQAMRDAGLKVYGYDASNNPYAESPRLAIQDIQNNNTLRYFRSDDGTTSLPADHPMGEMTDLVDDSGNRMSVNDVFRVVHDYFGHSAEGVGFGPRGEYNAYLQHRAMYSPEAQRALATETHGQNSYVNFGPDAEFNATASEADTRYAPQKAGLLPDEVTGAPFSQYAGTYPPVPTPVMKTDPVSGKSYLGKGSSPDVDAFMAQRAAIQKQIDAGNYTPYFDVGARYDADPSGYPTAGNTMTDAAPAKQATLDKHLAAINTPEARARLDDAYVAGQANGGNDRWYQMGQLEREFIDELGPEEGRAQFQHRFANAMAATTGGADPTSNLLMAHYGNYLQAAGQQIPDAAYKMPSPIGGRYATGNMAMYGSMADAGGLSAESNPKRFNFARNFLGDTAPSTIDEQMTSIIKPGQAAPKPGQYPAFQQTLNDAAAARGVDPRDFQDVAWGGFKAMKSGGSYEGMPMIQHVNEAIERTSQLTGLSPQEVVRRGLVRAQIPLYGVAGASLLSGWQPEGDQF